jgi:peptidoglycan/xylan/chitin deacetylase (PgdA/CDA1 family)
MWDVEPDTYYSGSVKNIVDYTIQNTKPGSIILLHPFCGSACEADRKALPEIIDGLIAKGYKFVTINQLLEYKK